eukprot:m.57990 g.57990  ORF g.57990 m.57990 type:complete len:84 (+) comp11146_c0_seq1:1803-2054(+)
MLKNGFTFMFIQPQYNTTITQRVILCLSNKNNSTTMINDTTTTVQVTIITNNNNIKQQIITTIKHLFKVKNCIISSHCMVKPV